MPKSHLRPAHAFCVALLAGLIALLPAATARADDPGASALVFEAVLGADGRLSVTQTLTFDAAPDELVARIATRQRIDDSSHYAYEVGDVTASIGGTAVAPTVTTDGDYLVVALDTTTATGQDVVIGYDVVGATHPEQSSAGPLTVLTWRVLQGLSVDVGQVSGSLRIPAVPELVDCTAGPPGTPDKCDLYAAGTADSPMPTFQTGARGAGEQVSVTVGVAGSAVQPTADVVTEWSLDRAFTLSPLTVGIALGTLLLGAGLIWWLHRRTGVDAEALGPVTPVGTFRPVGDGESVFATGDGVRPGLVGTVATERVDPIDVTATLLDLAVRGHLIITELPNSHHGLLDWSLTRTDREGADLFAYERAILDAIAPPGGQSLVSRLPSTLAPVIDDVQSCLYDEVVQRGWFDARPDATRSTWRTRGFVGTGIAVAAAVALVAFTTFGLLALVLLALAAALVWVADHLPRRTARGSQLVAGLEALSALIATHPVTEMPRGREIAEISRVLPYAVVLGGKGRWLDAMVQADEDVRAPDPDTVGWYRAPETWHLQDLPVSLTQFIHTVQGLLFAR